MNLLSLWVTNDGYCFARGSTRIYIQQRCSREFILLWTACTFGDCVCMCVCVCACMRACDYKVPVRTYRVFAKYNVTKFCQLFNCPTESLKSVYYF